MKVFNKEVNSCSECVMFDAEYGNCNYKYYKSTYKEDSGGSKRINMFKQCPFAQPITKEVIEGFGFKFNKYWKDYSIYRKNDSMYSKDEIDLWIAYHNKWYVVYIKTNHVGEFKGIVNNPQELEFILRSIRVIE